MSAMEDVMSSFLIQSVICTEKAIKKQILQIKATLEKNKSHLKESPAVGFEFGLGCSAIDDLTVFLTINQRVNFIIRAKYHYFVGTKTGI